MVGLAKLGKAACLRARLGELPSHDREGVVRLPSFAGPSMIRLASRPI